MSELQLIVNGERRTVRAKTIADVIGFFGLEGKPVIVEADGAILTKPQWDDAPVRDGMRIELVQFVGGG